MSDLVTLARRFVALTEELHQVRREIRRCVLDGAGGDEDAPLPKNLAAATERGRPSGHDDGEDAERLANTLLEP
jgi:hypothetical protein